ncbi:MAG TPA: hypothetical protein ENK57_03285 [Polyangiaceae bacterium]|nr:hypothetical protein [Polyangiaceae bacterium]
MVDEERIRRLETELATVHRAVEEHVNALDAIATALWGPERHEVAGGGRDSTQGVVERMERIETKLDRISRSRFTPAERAAIVVAAIGGAATIVSAVADLLIR